MATESEKEPEAKRLRSCEPDLLVIVGSGDSAKEYRYHSPVMATHSTYIDTMLATPMKESQSLTLKFPDLTPELWENMVKYLDPLHARTLSIETAMELAPVYDKYNFERGLKICDHVLSEAFRQNLGKSGSEVPTHDLDLLIDVFLLANDTNLVDTTKHAVSYFKSALGSDERYGKIMFSSSQIEKLVPLIVKQNLLRDDGMWWSSRIWSDEQIQSPLFPDHFVLLQKSEEMSKDLKRSVVGLELSGSRCQADGTFLLRLGEYDSGRVIDYGGVNRHIWIGHHEEANDDWVIYGQTEPELDEDGEPVEEPDEDTISDTKILWRNWYSSNLPLPPQTGWKSADERAYGTPEINEYIYKENH